MIGDQGTRDLGARLLDTDSSSRTIITRKAALRVRFYPGSPIEVKLKRHPSIRI